MVLNDDSRHSGGRKPTNVAGDKLQAEERIPEHPLATAVARVLKAGGRGAFFAIVPPGFGYGCGGHNVGFVGPNRPPTPTLVLLTCVGVGVPQLPS